MMAFKRTTNTKKVQFQAPYKQKPNLMKEQISPFDLLDDEIPRASTQP